MSKGMSTNENEYLIIDDYLEQLNNFKGLKSIRVEHILKKVNLSKDDVVKYLEFKIKNYNKLKLEYRIMCDSCYKYEYVLKDKDVKSYEDEECKYCGEYLEDTGNLKVLVSIY